MLDEVETLQRVRGDVREKGLNALRQLIDEVDGGRFPGLYLVITGTPAFFDGPQGVQRLPPLAQRLHVDFATDARVRQPARRADSARGFDHAKLCEVGRKVRDIYAEHCNAAERVRASADDRYIDDSGVSGDRRLGGKVGIAPRVFLKKLVVDVLDRIDQFEEFDPRKHYALTIADGELTAVERNAAARATSTRSTSKCDAAVSFERLHPALQHHIVNSLGWRSLRPLQERAIEPLIEGEHALLLGPTAGGKTEAAVFPLSLADAHRALDGLSLLYVCPLRALLNNLEFRLQRYARRRPSGRACGTATWAMLRDAPFSRSRRTCCSRRRSRSK